MPLGWLWYVLAAYLVFTLPSAFPLQLFLLCFLLRATDRFPQATNARSSAIMNDYAPLPHPCCNALALELIHLRNPSCRLLEGLGSLRHARHTHIPRIEAHRLQSGETTSTSKPFVLPADHHSYYCWTRWLYYRSVRYQWAAVLVDFQRHICGL